MSDVDLIGSTEAARIAGIKPSTFRTIRANKNTKTPVPKPVVTGLPGAAVFWRREDIEAWAATRDRSTGREPKQD